MSVNLSDIKGIGPSSVNDLGMHGIRSLEDLASASIAEITSVPGFGAARAAQVKQAALDLLGSGAAPKSPAPRRARSARKPAPEAANPKEVQADASEVLAGAEDGVVEETTLVIEKGGKGKKSKEDKATKGKKKDKGKKKEKGKKNKKKSKKK